MINEKIVLNRIHTNLIDNLKSVKGTNNADTVDHIMDLMIRKIESVNDKHIKTQLRITKSKLESKYGIDFGFDDSSDPHSWRNREWIQGECGDYHMTGLTSQTLAKFIKGMDLAVTNLLN